MSKQWRYEDTANSSAGTMICTCCGKRITEGRYRVRQKSKGYDWHYVTQHELCTSGDPGWAAVDARIDQSKRDAYALSDACREFKAKWGVDELDEYILPGGAA